MGWTRMNHIILYNKNKQFPGCRNGASAETKGLVEAHLVTRTYGEELHQRVFLLQLYLSRRASIAQSSSRP